VVQPCLPAHPAARLAGGAAAEHHPGVCMLQVMCCIPEGGGAGVDAGQLVPHAVLNESQREAAIGHIGPAFTCAGVEGAGASWVPGGGQHVRRPACNTVSCVDQSFISFIC